MVDITNQYSDLNKPRLIDGAITTVNIPDQIAWGVREVVFINKNALIVRVTGLKQDAKTMVFYLNSYNYGNWTGWIRLGNAGEIPGGRIWFM